ncbi:protein FAM210B, mitochondrial [Fundulus heteroclitus]|uniref:protein FAM210B, mitochondrial n=1 Tax=Fundulus heteroclitus TaxID=8078 RepID=UPI00165B5614|nr:protein FAM210B, mitochondrial [Fundulus heteroclitus]
MFLLRTGKLSAAALDQALQRPGSFLVRVNANGPRDVSLTGRTLRRLRFLSASAAGGLGPRRAHREPEPVHHWDTSACLITTERGLLDRVAAAAVNFSRSVHRGGGESSATGLGGDAKVAALFTGSSRGRSMPSRAASTGAATKRSDQQADSSNADHQEASSASSTEKNPGNTPEPEGGKPNKTQQLKKIFKEYGAVGVSFHIGISLMSLGMFYLLISSGIDMTALLCKLGFSEELVQSKMAAGTSTFVLAYAIHKLFAPVRISITVVSVPLIVRYFRKTGLFKPPTPAP